MTVSWNWFRGTDKSMLISHSDGDATSDVGKLRVTIHHNYFDGSRQRHPRVRFGEPVHVYNNYFGSNELYAAASTMNAGVLVEGNYFESVPFPCFSASGYADSGPGRLVQRNNVFTGSGTCETNGSVAEPSSYYSYTLDNPLACPRPCLAARGRARSRSTGRMRARWGRPHPTGGRAARRKVNRPPVGRAFVTREPAVGLIRGDLCRKHRRPEKLNGAPG